MSPELTAPNKPIAIRNEHVASRPSFLRIQQHGKAFHSGYFTIFRAGEQAAASSTATTEGSTFISVDGKYGTQNEKRTFRDAFGLTLFDVYHKPGGVTWFIELPDGTAVARLMPRSSLFKDKLDIEVKNAANNGVEVTLNVRGQDIWKQRTNVYFGDAAVMTAKRTDKLSTYLPRRKAEWTVEVAQGMDISLASAIIIVLAATMYNSSMVASSS